MVDDLWVKQGPQHSLFKNMLIRTLEQPHLEYNEVLLNLYPDI